MPFRKFMKKIPSLWLIIVIWALAFCLPRLPLSYLIPFNALLWLSAALLAPGKIYGFRLLRAALFFAGMWSLVIFSLSLFGAADLIAMARLWGFLALGLHLMLAKSPLELALPVSALGPVIGGLRARKLALALALMARLLPRLIASALKIKKTLDLRAARLPLKRRVALWGGALMRDSFSQGEEVARALFKRL